MKLDNYYSNFYNFRQLFLCLRLFAPYLYNISMEALQSLQSNLPKDAVIDGPTLEIAGMAVVEALDRRAEGEPMPFRVEIAPPPKGRSAKSHLALVASGVSLTLDARDKQDVIICDEYESSLVNADAITERVKTNLFTRHYRRRNPTLVFRELKPLEES
jgi:hypothetical protein